jgi:acetate kinase
LNLLIFNCGSSSLSFKLFSKDHTRALQILASGKAHRVGVTGTEASYIELNHNNLQERMPIHLTSHAQAAEKIIQLLQNKNYQPDAIGHRFVHGGTHFNQAVVITPQTKTLLLQVLPLAPIHNPNAYSVIQICQETYPDLPQFVSFDTTFHSSMPDLATLECLPFTFTEKHAIRHYGFHGLSYTYVLQLLSQSQVENLSSAKIIACHLGTGGSSITAIKDGKSIDTSMGYTPLQGLVMSTRCGDLDPFIPLFLMQVHNHTANELNQILNKDSGLLGLSGFSSDIRDILAQTAQNPQAQFAVDLLIHRLKKYIGAYAAILGGLDVLVFTDDIGIQNPVIRQRVCGQMDWLSLELDEQKNAAAPHDSLSEIQAANSAVRIFVLPTDEERIIAQDGFNLLEETHHADL